jgi:hypothetical protein
MAESYAGLPDDDEFAEEFGGDCEWCGSPVPVNAEINLELIETAEKLTDILNPSGFHPLWYCDNKCLTLDIELLREKTRGISESYAGLPDDDEFEEEESYCWRCDRALHDAYHCECGARYCERCATKDETIAFGEEGHMVSCPECVTSEKLQELGYGKPFAQQFAPRP